jgi:purine-binding chemotaxis protein CheW
MYMNQRQFEPEKTKDSDLDDLFLTFQVADETYAVNTACVREIVGVQHIAEGTGPASYIKGHMNLRGQIIPVMDQRFRFWLPSRGYDDRTAVIVLDLEQGPVGLVVDSVTDVLAIPQDRLNTRPRGHCQRGQGLIQEIGRLNDKISIVLYSPYRVHDRTVPEALAQWAQDAQDDAPAKACDAQASA